MGSGGHLKDPVRAAQEARDPESEHVVRSEALHHLRRVKGRAGREAWRCVRGSEMHECGGCASGGGRKRAWQLRTFAFCIMRSCGRTETASR